MQIRIIVQKIHLDPDMKAKNRVDMDPRVKKEILWIRIHESKKNLDPSPL